MAHSRSYTSGDGLTNAFVRSVHQDAPPQIWIGTDDGLFQVAGRTLRTARRCRWGTFPGSPVHAIYEDRAGQLWIGGSKLIRLGGGTATEYSLEGEASQNRVKSIQRDGGWKRPGSARSLGCRSWKLEVHPRHLSAYEKSAERSASCVKPPTGVCGSARSATDSPSIAISTSRKSLRRYRDSPATRF